MSRRVGDRRSEGICLLGLGINLLSKDLEQSLVYLQQAWQVQESTGSFNAAFDVALYLARAYTTKAIDETGIEADILTGISWRTLTTKPHVKDVHALGLARHWLERARELNSRAEIIDGEMWLILFEVPILKLENRTQDAITRLQSVLAPYQESNERPIRANDCYFALAKIYLRDLNRPDLALLVLRKSDCRERSAYRKHRME